ncbi:MAG: sporulation protein YlmC with PRC-barrel domain [Verrucomicrobiales bacterium]|jgi:sporulation protein YlmC with PRC-barrel domain
MLRSIKNLIGYPIHATDGDFGKVVDCLFDDKEWGLRYLVVHTHGLLNRHDVLISPRDLDQPEVGWFDRHVPVKLTKQEIEDSPSVDMQKPVSQLYEEEYSRYHQHHVYWEGSMIWGSTIFPNLKADDRSKGLDALHEARMKWIGDRTLRSAKEVIGYAVTASDGDIGVVADLILQTDQWRVRHLVVDTNKWLPGGKVLIDVDWTEEVEWARKDIVVNQTKETIRQAPTYYAHDPVNRDYEQDLYDYYGEPRYWEEKFPPVM